MYKEGNVKMETETGVKQSQVKQRLGLPEVGSEAGNRSFPRAHKVSSTLMTLDFELLASRTVRE